MNILFRLILCLVSLIFCASFASGAEDLGTVKGRLVQSDGEPQQDALFLLFNTQTGPPPAPGKYFRLPDDLGFVDKEGVFVVRLPPGEYWYAVVKELNEEHDMIPEYADWLYLSRSLEEGMITIKVEPGKTEDLGDVPCNSPLPQIGTKNVMDVKLVGVISDQDNVPLSNFMVEIFSKSAKANGPMFTSAVTSGSGQFSIKVAAGDYLLKVKALSGRNMNGYKNRTAEKYIIPKSKSISISGENARAPYNITIRDKSKITIE